MYTNVRCQHTLKPNARLEKPRHLFFLDTETLPTTLSEDITAQDFRLACGTYLRPADARRPLKQTHYHFDTIESVWETIVSTVKSNTTLYVIAHNWRFDLRVLGRFAWLVAHGWKTVFMYEKATTVFIKLANGTRKLVFVDDMNFFRVSLAGLGETIGLPKLEMPPFEAPDGIWFTYCERDVAIMVKAWRDLFAFIAEYELGSFKPTAASLSRAVYRHKFMKYPIHIHAHAKTIALERLAYHGARTEARKLGSWSGQSFYYVDVNSMYGFVMEKFDYPCNWVTTIKSGTISLLSKWLDTHCVIATVLLSTDEPVYPHKLKGRLSFGCGEFWETLTTRQLSYALSKGHIKEVGVMAKYNKAPLFKEFVSFFYSKRLEHKANGNNAYADLAKLLINSQYGKWGQLNEDWELISETPQTTYELWKEVNIDKGKLETYRIHDGLFERLIGSQEPADGFVAIAAEVTANAALYLYEITKIIGDENIYYYDTDGFIVNQAGLQNVAHLLSQTELGLLKIDKEADSLTISGLKDYKFGDHVVHKGIPSKNIPVDADTYRFEQMVSKGSKEYGVYGDRPVFKTVFKHLFRRYDKGILLPDGSVQPLLYLQSEGKNWLDWESMLELYGASATYRDESLYRTMYRGWLVKVPGEDRYADLNDADRMDAEGADLEQRRRGEMIYQRRK